MSPNEEKAIKKALRTLEHFYNNRDTYWPGMGHIHKTILNTMREIEEILPSKLYHPYFRDLEEKRKKLGWDIETISKYLNITDRQYRSYVVRKKEVPENILKSMDMLLRL